MSIRFFVQGGWSGGAMVLGKLPVPGRLTLWIPVGRGPSALAVGAGGGCLDIITLIYSFSTLSPSLWETARYRLKYCLKGPLNPEQPTKFLSKFQNHVSQEAQRIESTVAHSWHRVCLSVTFPIRKVGFVYTLQPRSVYRGPLL